MNVIVSNKYQSMLASLDIDVIKSINGEFTVEELTAQFSNFFYNRMIIDITAIKDYLDINVIKNLTMSLDMSKSILLLDDSETVNSPIYISQLISMGIYNFTTDLNGVKYLLDNPNTYKDVASYHNVTGFKSKVLNEKAVDNTRGKIIQKVVGFVNLTEHAGATTLVYMLKNHLEVAYKVKAVEVDKNDFEYFDSENLDSISSLTFSDYLANNNDYDAILVDINDSDVAHYCHEVIYLVEPGLIGLNRLIQKDNMAFQKLSKEKIVLNKCVLEDREISDFEKESGIEVFYAVPYVNDRSDDVEEINMFLSALGFTRIDPNANSGMSGIF